MGKIIWKRVYDSKSDDNYRVLVDRLWPRGLKKEIAQIDYWPKEITPTSELRKKYHEGIIEYEEFKEKYVQEIENNVEFINFVNTLKEKLKDGDVTIVYGSKNPELSHIPILKNMIEKNLK